MVINETVVFGQSLQVCSHCHKHITDIPFVTWDFMTSSGIANVVFHHDCASKFMLRFARDLYQIDCETK